MKKISLFNLLVFLSAFLLFQIELIVAKILLPHYGGIIHMGFLKFLRRFWELSLRIKDDLCRDFVFCVV